MWAVEDFPHRGRNRELAANLTDLEQGGLDAFVSNVIRVGKIRDHFTKQYCFQNQLTALPSSPQLTNEFRAARTQLGTCRPHKRTLDGTKSQPQVSARCTSSYQIEAAQQQDLQIPLPPSVFRGPRRGRPKRKESSACVRKGWRADRQT